MTFGWLDIEDIALALHEAHPRVDPLTLRFTALRGLVEALPGFAPDPAHPVNEKILESIQVAWHEERMGIQKDED
ncbi:MAG: Fe-S cluster assembly protein IscX [Phycisphaerales bacterium]|nr:Fe-S cluster assembly protein IscX [Phycisphaerales bacterium]